MKYLVRFSLFCCLLAAGLQAPLAQSAEKVIYYHNDGIGSPILATDESGDVLWREEYTPYGSRLVYDSNATKRTCQGSLPCEPVDSHAESKQWFTAKYEESRQGIQYFGARWYDPSIGRFLSPDPVPFVSHNPFSFNQYAYANNNPYIFVDPDGRIAVHVGRGSYLVGRATVTPLVNYAIRKATAGRYFSLGDALYGVFNESQDDFSNDDATSGERTADDPLPRDENGNPAPESEYPHTQLGKKKGRSGEYPQGREFGEKGEHVKDIDFTDHGRSDHANPHEHPMIPNSTGGTPKRGPQRPLNGG